MFGSRTTPATVLHLTGSMRHESTSMELALASANNIFHCITDRIGRDLRSVWPLQVLPMSLGGTTCAVCAAKLWIRAWVWNVPGVCFFKATKNHGNKGRMSQETIGFVAPLGLFCLFGNWCLRWKWWGRHISQAVAVHPPRLVWYRRMGQIMKSSRTFVAGPVLSSLYRVDDETCAQSKINLSIYIISYKLSSAMDLVGLIHLDKSLTCF